MTKQKRIQDKQVLHSIKEERCVVCGRNEVDPAHIKSRGSGGDDVSDNLLPLCRLHHTEQHKIGWVSFSRKYITVELLLLEKGWQLETIFGNTKLVRK